MDSTSFADLTSPIQTGEPLRMARGGKARPQPKGGALSQPQAHHTIIVVPVIHPVLGALAHAAMLHHARHRAAGGR